MNKLTLILGCLLCLNFGLEAQVIRRAINVNLDPKMSYIFDSLFLANDWRKKLEEEYKYRKVKFKYDSNWKDKRLNVEDSIPDLELGTIYGNSAAKKRFSEYEGKVLILDFWATHCSSCIAGFPKMEKLQRQFGDKIQIVLVNTSEDEQTIRRKMGKNISKIPNLPSYVNARHLWPYFPAPFVGNQVWIDAKGLFLGYVSHYNMSVAKIQDVIDKKTVEFLETSATKPFFDALIPYAHLVGFKISPNVYNSFFTSFNKNYMVEGDGRVQNFVDSLKGTIRNTFINFEIKQLYLDATLKQINVDNKIIFKHHVEYEVKDTLRYTSDFLAGEGKITDLIFMNNRFCFEQIYPQNISKVQAPQMMLEDLNSYFGKLYGTFGRIEKRTVPGYVIKRLSGKKYKQLFSKNKDYATTESNKNGRKMVSYTADEFNSFFDVVLRAECQANKKILKNETGIDGGVKIDIEIPLNATLLEIKYALRSYGLEIVEKAVEAEFLVISDTKNK